MTISRVNSAQNLSWVKNKRCAAKVENRSPKFYFYSGWMGTKMEIGGEAMHLRSRDPWHEGHAALCAKRRPPPQNCAISQIT